VLSPLLSNIVLDDLDKELEDYVRTFGGSGRTPGGPAGPEQQNGPNRFKELRRRGVPTFHAAVAAGSPTGFWRM
jgi:hypothetical protein